MEWIGSFVVGILIFSVVYQIAWCASLSVIARKNDESDLMQVLAWIPLLQMIPMIVVGGGSPLRFLLGFLGFIVASVVVGMATAVLGSGVGILGIVMMFVLVLFYLGRLFWNTAAARDLPGWVGLLLFIPIVNIFVHLHIAFHDGFELPHKVGLALGLVLTFASFAPSFQAMNAIRENGGFPTDAEGWAALAQNEQFAALAAQMEEQNALDPSNSAGFDLEASASGARPSAGGNSAGGQGTSEASIQALFALQERFNALERATSGANLHDPVKRTNAAAILRTTRAELDASREALGSETYNDLATHLVEIEALLADPSSRSSFSVSNQQRNSTSRHGADASPASIARSSPPAPMRPLPVQVTGDCASNTELRSANRDGHEEEWCEQNAAAGGLRHGWYAKYLENGQPISVGEYEGGLRVGVWTRFYPSGSVRMQAEFANGLQHGWLLSFDESGQRTKAVRFSDGAAIP